MKLQQKPPRPTASENNLIPMINVVFLLLIFFMVAGMVRIADPLPLNAPESTTNNPVIADSVLYVTGDGTLKLDDTSISMTSLGATLEELKAIAANSETAAENFNQVPGSNDVQLPNDAPLLAIKADARVTVSFLRDILDTAKDAGLSRVELITSWVPVNNR